MNGIKKMMGLVLIVVFSACSPEANEIETQNLDFEIANSTRSESENVVIDLIIEFAPHISEAQKDEIREWVAQDGNVILWEPIGGSAKELLVIVINPDCFSVLDDPASLGDACDQLIKKCPELKKVKHLEDNGDLTTECDDTNGFPHH